MIDDELIDESVELINWLDHQIDELEIPGDVRHRISAGCFDIATEVHKSIVLLISYKLNAPAFSLARLFFETLVRGVWLYDCADENDLKNFEIGKIPRFFRLVEDVEKHNTSSNEVLSRMKKNYWNTMNDYAHTGIRSIARRQTENSVEANYSDDEILEVLNYANALGYSNAIVACNLAKRDDLVNEILSRFDNDPHMKKQNL